MQANSPVKMHTVSLPLLALFLTVAAIPATAQCPPPNFCTIYDNGPVNGQVNALLINSGSAVTDTFSAEGFFGIETISFGVWLIPGDSLQSVEVSVGEEPYGTEIFRQTVNVSGTGDCFNNRDGYNVCEVSVDLFFEFAGTVWLTLQNARSGEGNPVYWDQNSGVGCTSQGCPSRALEKTLTAYTPASALVPSEAFCLYGAQVDSK